MRRSLAALALAVALAPSPARAQAHAAAARPTVSRGGASSLRAQIGVPVAVRLLQSDAIPDRVRGVERLAAIGTTEAIDALLEALEAQSGGMADARVRLTAVRALAGEVKRDNVRQLLVRELTGAARVDARSGTAALAPLLRGTAALALARSGDRKAVAALAAAMLPVGAPAEAAAAALRAYPPESLEALLDIKRATPSPRPAEPAAAREAQRRLSLPLAAFLGDIGDLRAIERLRSMLGEGEVSGKITAALALARLGDASALPAAREWSKKSEPRLRLAAAEVLVALDAPEAPDAVKVLLESDSGREDGVRLALAAPSPTLAAPLAKLLPTLAEDARPRVIAALGRARGAAELAALLDKPWGAVDAAFALATMPGDEARGALAQAMASDAGKKPEARRLFARAATVRALMLDDAPSKLEAALEALWRSKDATDRAVGAFGLVALGSLSLGDAIKEACDPKLRACDAAIVGASARGALARGGDERSLAPLLALLAQAGDTPGPEAIAAGVALLALPDGGALPTQLLATWAEGGGPLSPLAARALPSRDDEALRGRIKRLLEGTDPVVRAHVALGLGRDPEPSATALLVSAYRFEEDAGVRRAVVRALSRRAEVQRMATLVLARDLDPDDDVRALARAALDGRDLDPAPRPVRGPEPRRSVAWVNVRATDRAASSPHAAKLVRADGLAIPVLADPDGVLLIPGLPAGSSSLLLGRP